MGRGPSAEGEAIRRLILEDLARRYREFGPPPSAGELRKLVVKGKSTLDYHLRLLREAGLVHPDSLWITRAGFEAIAGTLGLTA